MPNPALRSLLSSDFLHQHQASLQQPECSQVPNSRILAPSSDHVYRGLCCREFRAYLQPKLDLRSGKLNSVEVLARWHHPQRGVLSPADFIPLMEREKWLDTLLFELLEQSLACQLKLYDEGRLISLAFNLSMGQLMNCTFIERLEARLRQHPLPLSALTFEITEGGPAVAPVASIEQLNCLSRLGVRLSIDDFGTGYSSLLRLCQVPFSEIKLDGVFTRFLDSHGRYCAVIRNTLALANELGMQLVVEGIESAVQHKRLLEMGVSVGQGFLYAKPMPIDVFEGWIYKPDQYFQTRSAS